MDTPLPPLSDAAARLHLGRYRHYKGGEYDVIAVARHSETLEEMVIYRRVADASWWARPLTMFSEDVEVAGKSQPRFIYLGSSSDPT